MKRAAVILLLVAATSLHAAESLRIVKAGPVGEVAQLAEANEVRIVFSEPMVAIAKIPKNLTVPWFHIAPAVNGTFRWSGTTTLIFTPKGTLPFATKFDVTIGKSAASLAGNTLDRPYTFSFTTPTIQLLAVPWYRKGDVTNGPIVIGLRFNQPVDPQTILAHVHLRTKGHEFTEPPAPETPDPRFQEKRDVARKAAASNGDPIFAGLALEWDEHRIPPTDRHDLVVLETKPNIAPGTWIEVYLDSELAGAPKSERTGRAQDYTVQLWPPLLVNGINCFKACDPDYQNAVTFRRSISFAEARRTITVTDITDPKKELALKPVVKEGEQQPGENDDQYVSLDELGYSVQPAHTYRVRVDHTLTSTDGQTLGYDWDVTVVNWHRTAFTSFGDGHGVWESSGGPILPFSSRNFRSVKQWLAPLALDRLMPTILDLQSNGFTKAPPSPPQERMLNVIPDKIQAYGLDVSPAIGATNKGLVWVAVQEGEPIPQSRPYGKNITRSTVVQVTNLGISVKDSPLNTVVMVTRLDDAAPVAGATVSIRTPDNKVFWSGATDANGIVNVPNTNLRVVKKEKPPEKPGQRQRFEDDDWENSWEALSGVHFLVTAEKDGDIAYASSDWHDGIEPWDFSLNFNLTESQPLLRGTIFTDRGVYKLGEEVHVKAVVRSDTPAGLQLLPSGTKVEVELRDSHDKPIDTRTVPLNEWSSSEWTVKIPADAPLGSYRFIGRVEGQRLRAMGNFLVAAYRRPEFRVDVALTAPSTVAGVQLDGTVTARYLFGAPMSGMPVKWTYAKHSVFDVPAKVTERFPEERYTFLGWEEGRSGTWSTLSTKEQKLDAKGELHLKLDTQKDEGWPAEYRLEGNVTDVSRQQIAGRTTYRVDPAPWYIGVRTPPYFAESANGIDTDIVAVAVNGTVTPGVKVAVELYQIQWVGARQAEGEGFYDWDMTRKEVPAGNWDITTQSQPVPLHIPLKNGGEYLLLAKAGDGEGRVTKTRVSFYAVGAGYTSWERYDHNRIDLVPEKKSYRPGETARIMIKSPWERATALLTTEREGVRTTTPFQLTSTQQTVTVPLTERDIPNVFVSVLLVKGRTKDATTTDESDPGKPSFRLGYTELKVEDALKRLKVDVKANRDEYRPASKARIEVNVRDANGAAAQSEVTLWAVDYGVLSLTAYQTPDVLESMYLDKALQVVTEDSREKIISRRVITPKGAGEGGGGGRDAGPGMIRKDFRVLAFWLGSIVTDKNGRARTDVTLPESLTTYRIMAVAADKQSRFGWGQNEIRINKPLLLTPTFPRFMAVTDKAFFGAVVHSQLKNAGTATVSIKSLDPDVIQFTDELTQKVSVPAAGSAEVRWNAIARSAGAARIQVTVGMNGERDAFDDTIPVRVFVTPETFAAYGQANPKAQEQLQVPTEVVPGFGGLHLELSSTMLVGLGEGARYLVDYPYGCAEQRASSALALMLASDLGDAFKLPGIDPSKTHDVAQTTLNELPKFQCGDGGFSFWAGDCSNGSPYLTSYVLHVLQRGQKMKYAVDANVMNRAYDFLERKLNEKRPENEGWWPAYTAWQAFAVKVLVEGGRNEDSHINRLMGYLDRMPVFGMSSLLDVFVAKGETGKRPDELHRRITNAILPEGGTAHVEELADPYLLWFWNSNVRSTAIALGTLVRQGNDEELVRRMVRWMMQVRKNGRWGNTQENAWAMESLVDYYRRYESETPDFTAVTTIGTETLARETFRGRSTEAKAKDVPIAQVPSGTVTFDKQGTGILFYLMRLRYAPLGIMHDALDQGFHVERHYSKASFAAGDLIEVTLRLRNTKERRFVAVTDPIPAGTEPVESWFATTAAEMVMGAQPGTWREWWESGGFDHVERHDDRVDLFATRLSEGVHEFKYLIRATTVGTFVTAPTHVEEMYEPEVFGRTATDVIEVKP